MILLTAVLVSTHFETAPLQRIDFRLLPAAGAHGAETAERSPSTAPPRASEIPEMPAIAARPRPKNVNPAIARGFGADVPLDFAARQIVPIGVRVVYGPGIDRHQATSWTGGTPWNRTLQDAIRPLGLRMTLAGQVVTITR